MNSGVMRASGALRHAEHLATMDLDPHVAIPEILHTLNTVVPGARAGFFWVGGDGSVVDACHAGAIDAAPLVASTQNGLRVDLKASDTVRAVLSVRRSVPLAERERRLYRAALPSLRRALGNHAPVVEHFDPVPETTGVLTTTADGRLIGAGPAALLMVAEMDGRPLVGNDVPGIRLGERLPSFIADLCTRRAAHPTASAILHKTSRWGAYRAEIHAQLADGAAPSHAVVVIAKHLPHRIGLMRRLKMLDLSPRERQVAFELGIGADAAQGAVALGVSIATWRSYVKRVYSKLGVRDRIEVFAALNHRADVSGYPHL